MRHSHVLTRVLADGLQASEWYALLNQFVFLWPSRERLERQKRAYHARPQVVLVFDAEFLLSDVGDRALVSPIKSGNARRRAARRGLKTLVPYTEWKANGWGLYDDCGTETSRITRTSGDPSLPAFPNN